MSLKWDECSSWLYAFVADQRVRYIGLTTNVLRTRLDGYSYQKGDLSKELNRVGALIRQTLENNTPVTIYGARRVDKTPDELDTEETALIQLLDTDWNIAKRS